MELRVLRSVCVDCGWVSVTEKIGGCFVDGD